MPDRDLPQGTAGDEPLSFDQGVEDITDILTDPETDLPENDGEKDEAEGTPDAEADDAQDDDPVGEEDENGSGEESSGGRFVSSDAKFRLEDGTVISVGDLARNNLYQRDYTRKTTELKAERETFEAQRSKVGEYAQALAAQRDFLLQASQRLLPQAPDRSLMDSDPIGYMQAKATYDEAMQMLSQIQYAQQAEHGRRTEEQKEKFLEYRRTEARKLLDVLPELKKPETYQRFWNEAVDTMAHYGYSEQELHEASDHRLYRAMHDLVKYRKALKRAPQVQQEVQGKPKLIGGSKRMDPKQKISRERTGRTEQLRKSGSLEAGIAALMDIPDL